ncbi:MAG: GIY-YIG nuclease family protein [Pseudomonadales bacterium]|nr:GIY-YIG nuclease family protein [Pseudomonadales bacterium]
MKTKQSIIYVMRHIDIGGHIDIPYKKVGITGAGNATLDSRLQQISNTKSPIKAQCVAAWEYRDAKKLEDALHLLLEDSRVEGEWFYDKEDSLVTRMHPIMELIGAKEIQIKESDDVYTKSIMQKEDKAREQSEHILLGEMIGLFNNSLRSSSRKAGPTFFGAKQELTYYVAARKSGNHNLSIGRSKNIYMELSKFLESKGFDVEQGKKGTAIIFGKTSKIIVEIIEMIEDEF